MAAWSERARCVWEGAYARAFEGAYFARQLNEARQQKRIGFVAADPILPVRARGPSNECSFAVATLALTTRSQTWQISVKIKLRIPLYGPSVRAYAAPYRPRRREAEGAGGRLN